MTVRVTKFILFIFQKQICDAKWYFSEDTNIAWQFDEISEIIYLFISLN
jgi:hypothetical protein